MTTPIPDEVLRRLVDPLAAGDTLTFLTECGHEQISAKAAFSELLALRGAARGMNGVACCPDHIRALRSMIALLPPPAAKEAP